MPHLIRRLAQHLDHHRPAYDGLLDGIAGVRLAQHTVAANTPHASRWDACLLLDI